MVFFSDTNLADIAASYREQVRQKVNKNSTVKEAEGNNKGMLH